MATFGPVKPLLKQVVFFPQGCFLDNLQRKGRDGYNVFLECLVETHPNVYRRLTGQEPEAPVREPINGSYTTGVFLS